MRGMFVACLLLAATAGCTGAYAFRDVDLWRDLGKETLDRYETEWRGAGSPACPASVERTDTWPLGILLYWSKGSVVRSGDGGYRVGETLGLGPLSLLYVSETHALFGADGRRQSTMAMSSVLWGHIAMWHESDAVLVGGGRERSWSAHLLHHIVNIHGMDGHVKVCLFSMPNVVGVSGGSGGPCH